MYIWPNVHFPENLFSRIYTCQNVHLDEITFPRMPQFTLARMYIWPDHISPKPYLPKFILASMYVWPKSHFSENYFSRIYSCQNVDLVGLHFPENLFAKNYTHKSEISFSIEFTLRKYIIGLVYFQKLVSCV